VTDAMDGVTSLEAMYLHPFGARHSALIDATETVTAGAGLDKLKQEGSIG
jgi:hypothetical protein